jgi:hypothetical protein
MVEHIIELGILSSASSFTNIYHAYEKIIVVLISIQNKNLFE